MQRETELNVADLLETRHSALDLLTSPTTFIDDALAAFYGVAKPSGASFARVSLPPGRIGYLTSGTFLSITAHAASTSPTRRGVYIMQNLLCRAVPPPPPNVNTMFPVDDGSTTTRQRLEAHRANPTCAACHGLFDPIGVAFEHFDALGAYRDQENNLAIDATGQLDGTTYDGAVGLAQLLRSSREVARCLVSGAYRYNTGHNIVAEAEGEGAVIDGLTKTFDDSGQDYVALLSAIAKSESFRSAVGQY